MGDIIVYIPKDIDAKLFEKIAEMLRIHKIKTTNDISQASVIVHIPNTKLKMTTEEIALTIIEQTNAEIFELKERLSVPDIPVIMPRHAIKNKKIISNCNLKRFYKTKLLY